MSKDLTCFNMSIVCPALGCKFRKCLIVKAPARMIPSYKKITANIKFIAHILHGRKVAYVFKYEAGVELIKGVHLIR